MLEPLKGLGNWFRRGTWVGPNAASDQGQKRREKEKTQECKKPAVLRNDQSSSFVEGTGRD